MSTHLVPISLSAELVSTSLNKCPIGLNESQCMPSWFQLVLVSAHLVPISLSAELISTSLVEVSNRSQRVSVSAQLVPTNLSVSVVSAQFVPTSLSECPITSNLSQWVPNWSEVSVTSLNKCLIGLSFNNCSVCPNKSHVVSYWCQRVSISSQSVPTNLKCL